MKMKLGEKKCIKGLLLHRQMNGNVRIKGSCGPKKKPKKRGKRRKRRAS